jgi:hypothetical protein
LWDGRQSPAVNYSWGGLFGSNARKFRLPTLRQVFISPGFSAFVSPEKAAIPPAHEGLSEQIRDSISKASIGHSL